MKNKGLLIVVLMGSILSFLPQILWAGGIAERTLKALDRYDEEQARLTSELQRLDGTDPSFSPPGRRVSSVPTIRIGDLELTCKGEARVEYNQCLEGQEEQCGEELQPFTPSLARAPYLVCPSDEKITSLPCKERSQQTLETCNCKQEADERYEVCLQTHGTWWCDYLREMDYLKCSPPHQDRRLWD